MTVGYIGLGNMGGRLARRLLLGMDLVVFDLDKSAVSALVELGATGAGSAREVAEQCNIVFLCLPMSRHVRAVVEGPDGIAGVLSKGDLVIDQTTGDPALTRELAAVLAESGVELIDAPVSGGPMGADAGTIAIMVGASAEQYARIEPVLQVISPNIFHAGEVGTGHVIKLVNNMLSAVHRAVSVEALALGEKNGVSIERALDIILASSGRNFYLETFGRSHLQTGKLASGFTLELLHKDVRLACELGDTSEVPLYFGNLAKEFYRLCMNMRGGAAEVNEAAIVMDSLAGSHLVRTVDEPMTVG